MLVSGFERPNLKYVIRESENKLGQLLKLCNGVEGSGIVYVARRKSAEDVAAFLQSQGVDAAAYHAGMNGKVRARINIPADSTQEQAIAAAKADPTIAGLLDGKSVVKEIYVPGRLVNIVAK